MFRRPYVKALLLVAGIALAGWYCYIGFLSYRWRREEQQFHEAMSRIHSLSMVLWQYTDRHKGTLPPMDNPADLRRALKREGDFYNDPATGLPFQPNPSLSRRPIKAFKDPDRIVSLYEPTPYPQWNSHQMASERVVAFLDGSARTVSERDWEKLKQFSHIP